jgi:hypothetical protein
VREKEDYTRATMVSLGNIRIDLKVCTFNRRNRKGVQCKACVRVDDLLTMSKSINMCSQTGYRKDTEIYF